MQGETVLSGDAGCPFWRLLVVLPCEVQLQSWLLQEASEFCPTFSSFGCVPSSFSAEDDLKNIKSSSPE